MNLLHTINTHTGEQRFYINGKRVSRAAYDATTEGKRLDCFNNNMRGVIVHHHACAH